jgi:L-alanine-DL-glutamate epimerase-like enolase superfamily enzyme
MAEVADLRTRLFRSTSADGVAMSFAPMGHRVMMVVEVTLDDGTVGLGETWANFPHWAWQERRATLLEGVRPRVLGMPVSHLDDVIRGLSAVLDELVPLGRQWGAPGPVHQAVSGVEMALWDAVGRREGRSIGELAGGHAVEELLAYGSSIGPTGVEESTRRCLELGLRAVKAKVGFGRDHDLTTVRSIRAVLGEGVQVFADANQAWDRVEAEYMLKALADLDVAWVEEPLAGDDPTALSELSIASGMSIATGENVYGAGGFARYIGAEGIAILQPDLTKCGGISPYLAVTRAAADTGQSVAPHLYNGAVATAATLQVAAATGAPFVEWDIRHNTLREPVNHLLTDRGTLIVPTGVGLGVDIDLADFNTYEEEL